MFCKFGSDDAKPPRRRRGQRVAGVNAAALVDVRRQRVGVGRLQLGQLPPFDHGVDEAARVVGQFFVGGEIIEQTGARFPLAGFGFLAARKFQIVEQEFAELLGRRQIELVAGELIDFFFEPRRALRKCAGQPRENGAVDFDAGLLHRDDDRHQRPLERFIDVGHAFGREPRLQLHPQPQRDVGIFGGVFGRFGDRHAGKCLVGFFRARRVFDDGSRTECRCAPSGVRDKSSMPWPPRPPSST